MESMTWLLTFGALAWWLHTGAGIVRRPPAFPAGWRTETRRLFWVPLWLAALVAGAWGPEVWSNTRTDHQNVPGASAVPTERTFRTVRTPFAVQVATMDRNFEGQEVRREERLALQIPIALLAFLLAVSLLHRGHGPSIPSVRGRAGLVLVVLAGVAACSDGGVPGEEAPRPERVFAEVQWDTLLHLQIPADDTLLYHLSQVAAGEAGLWVLDRMGHRLAHLGWDGELQWYAGRQGAGPGEFMNPRSISLDRHGVAWVLDVGTHRISGFDAKGRLETEVPLAALDGVLHDFASDEEGETFFGMVLGDGLRPVAIDRGGAVETGSAIRVPDAEGAAGIAFQGSAEGARSRDRWVYAFAMGDGLYRMEGTAPSGPRILFPELVPFPVLIEERVESGNVTSVTRRLPEPRFSAQEVGISGERILVRFQGETDRADRLVDVFGLDSGTYLETLTLPTAGSMSVWENRIILTRHDPTPELLVLEKVGG
ncbi:MAG: hypothetical protein WD960_11255 [Gemmatimonadota bacterium]